MEKSAVIAAAQLLGIFLGADGFAQPALNMQACEQAPPPPFCRAVRGARAEGWPAQSRSEVMAQHGMVVTSQPLAAQAGLQILKGGGNAVDAAVATAAVLNVVEPMMEGVGGDLFAVIYVAKERKVYVLNASGTAPTGATVERLNELGYHWDSKNWGSCVGNAGAWDPARDRSRRRLGLAGSAQTFRDNDLQTITRARGPICRKWL